jgi:exonuclease SbcD
MKILHTSDWHLGHALYGRKRYEEFEAFLNWLAELLKQEEIDALLVAGDIFDNTTPSNRAQELYYRFLCRVAESSCRYAVITGGNHDSPSFLNAPRELLRYLQVYVVANKGDELKDEVLLLRDSAGKAELIVCAVPYLRDRDIRSVEAGESLEDKELKLVEGIRDHYAQVVNLAREIQNGLVKPVPIIAMGHLFAAGGTTIKGDGVRELYVGSLAHVGADIFPEGIDYLALGHLHTAQKIGRQENYRYSGAPLPMGFGEAGWEKQVIKVEFTEGQVRVTPIKVPLFQALYYIRGDLQEILDQMEELKTNETSAWLEIAYEGQELIPDLREKLDDAAEGTGLEILRVNNKRLWGQEMSLTGGGEVLTELDAAEVFVRCLDANGIDEVERQELLALYQEVVESLDTEDWMEE